ncbi:hypothetical protein NBH13_00025 [Bifidobacterium sp. M3-R-103]|uniref:Histidine kinase n=2 Tax=Bifidobacterium TaxID=1678 RepID=A0ABV1CDD2_9BIFI|nr:hypothetical protein [Bifidobacterium sp. M3-R-103]MCM0691644.1 hypothetical protein [Bifidobacterium sp. M3-R-103]
MMRSPSSFFLDAVRPYPRGFRLSYLFMSVSIVVLEVVFHAISAPLGTHDILILAALCALLSVAPWLGITGDLLYVAVFAAMGAFSSSLAFPVLGVFLVAAVWIIRHRTAQAALLLAGYVLLMFWQNGSVLARMASDVLLSSVAVVVGFAVRKFMDGAELSRRELEESRMGTVRAVESVRAKLAAGLHDTIARDLARISISLESLAAAHPDLSGEIAPIVDLAHDSSRRLRPMISELSLDAAAPSLAAAVEESRLMLRSGALELDAHMPGDIDGEISRQTILTGSLFVSETAANALKYARRGTTVDLFAEIDGGGLSLTMANDISGSSSDGALTGGFGLANLKSRIESEGGRLSFVSRSGRWIVNASIPDPKIQGEGAADE